MERVVNQINENGKKISRISWPAVFAGTLAAVAIAFLLNILGLGIGFSTIDPLTEANPLDGLGTGTTIWWILSNLAALFIGGLIAARMSGYASNIDGALHGFLTWALFAVLSFYFITSTVGSIFNGMASAASSLFSGNDSKNIKVQLDETNKKGQQNTGLSYDRIKGQLFKIINVGEKYNMLPEDASEESRDFLQSSKKEFQNLNLEEDIESFFNEVSFDLDNNGDLDINVAGNKDFFDKTAMKNYLSNNTRVEQPRNQWSYYQMGTKP